MTTIFAVILILLSVFSRIIPHAPNFTPIIAVALFAAVYLKKPLSFLVPLIALFVSDAIIGFYGGLMIFVYGSLLCITAFGFLMRNNVSIGYILGFSITSATLFFVISNFGVWVTGLYPRTFAGLLECYTMAIPFFRNTLGSTLIYSCTLFGTFELVKRYATKKEIVKLN